MGDDAVSAAAVSTSAFAADAYERRRFYVELKGERAVSWKKLLKTLPQPAPADAPSGAKSALEARLAPEAVLATGASAAAPNRFNNVIEKIERLYQGRQSDDDSISLNALDDDQYNTDDSFIDDEDLDEYFSVDNAKTKHNGFFVNKGKLESVSEPLQAPLPKKRKRKTDTPQEQPKKPKPSSVTALLRWPNPYGECMVNKQADTQPQAVRCLDEQESFLKQDRVSFPERSSMPTGKANSILKYPGTAAGRDAPRGTVLERAVQELRLGVAQLCPANPPIEPEQASTHCGKAKRLPKEIRQKLAKVARLAAKQGKISDEAFLHHLMGILGHLMQLKTLKRNLKEMVEMGMIAKHEREGRLMTMKREFMELVHSKLSFNRQKAIDSSNDLPPASGGQYKWDEATEDRVCELYDHSLEGIDENKSSQSRKFFSELAKMWPEGWMDKEGIKGAIQRAKERRKALSKMQAANELMKRKALEINEGVSSSAQTSKLVVCRQQMPRPCPPENIVMVEKRDDAELVLLKFRKQKPQETPCSRETHLC